MPTEYKRNQVILTGHVSVEEAEDLLAFLQNKNGCKVDFSGCDHIHPSSLQVLMVGQVKVLAWPQSEVLKKWLQSALNN